MAAELEKRSPVPLTSEASAHKPENDSPEMAAWRNMANAALYNTGQSLWRQFGPELLAEETPEASAMPDTPARLALEASTVRLELEPPQRSTE